jgi:hypothetical protein
MPPACTGDCDGRTVTINELIRGVASLGTAPTGCPAR